MSTKEGLLRLEAAGTLHLFTLNAHGLSLVLQVHVLYLFLSAQLHLLLAAHCIKAEA